VRRLAVEQLFALGPHEVFRSVGVTIVIMHAPKVPADQPAPRRSVCARLCHRPRYHRRTM